MRAVTGPVSAVALLLWVCIGAASALDRPAGPADPVVRAAGINAGPASHTGASGARPRAWHNERTNSPVLWAFASAAEADSYVAGSSGVNHGSDTLLEVGRQSGTVTVESSGFVRMPIALPPNADVEIANLTLSLFEPVRAGEAPSSDQGPVPGSLDAPRADPIEIRTCPAQSQWSEGTITGANAPAALGSHCTAQPVDDDVTNPDKSWDVTDAVRAMAAGTISNNGFRLDPVNVTGTNARQFVSGEASAEVGPRLDAYYYLLTGSLTADRGCRQDGAAPEYRPGEQVRFTYQIDGAPNPSARIAFVGPGGAGSLGERTVPGDLPQELSATFEDGDEGEWSFQVQARVNGVLRDMAACSLTVASVPTPTSTGIVPTATAPTPTATATNSPTASPTHTPTASPTATATAMPTVAAVGCPRKCALIDFETEADGTTPIGLGAVVDTEYESLYATFALGAVTQHGKVANPLNQALVATAGRATVGGAPGPLVIHFSKPQSYVALSVGLAEAPGEPVTAILRAYRYGESTPVAESSALLGPGPAPLSVRLSVNRTRIPSGGFGDEGASRTTVGEISRVELEVPPNYAEIVDDVEFDVFGVPPPPPPPPCAGATPPEITIREPWYGLSVSENKFPLQGIVETSRPLERVEALIIGDGGTSRFDLSVYGSAPYYDFAAGMVTDQLVAGRNSVFVVATDACASAISTDSVHVEFAPRLGGPPGACPSTPLTNVSFTYAPAGAARTQWLNGYGLIVPVIDGLQKPVIDAEVGLGRLQPIESGQPHAGPLVLQFAWPMRSVWVRADADPGVAVELRAYSRANGGALVHSARTVGDSGIDDLTVSASSVADIARVELEYEGAGVESVDSLQLEPECDAPRTAPDTVDVRVLGMEVTQATNRAMVPNFVGPMPYDGVPLVAGKRTVVRAYAALDGADFPEASVPAVLVAFRGAGATGGEYLGSVQAQTALTGTRGATISVFPESTLDELRGHAERSWNFLLPPEWITEGRLRLEVQVNDPPVVHECTDESCVENNVASMFDVPFVVTRDITIIPVDVVTRHMQPTEEKTPLGSAVCTFTDAPLDVEDFCIASGSELNASRPGYFPGVYPVREGGVSVRPVAATILSPFDPDDEDFTSDMMSALLSAFGADTLLGFGASASVPGTAAVALVPNSFEGLTDMPAFDYRPFVVTPAYGKFDWSEIRWVFPDLAAHEFGHTLGFKHASIAHEEQCDSALEPENRHCEPDWPYPHGGIGEFGFYTRQWKPVSPGDPLGTHAHDFMSYGDGFSWTSPRQWCRALDKLGGGTNAYCDRQRSAEDIAASAAAAAAKIAQAEETDALVIQGRVHIDGVIQLAPLHRIRMPLEPVAPDAEAPIQIMLKAEGGATLATYPARLPPVMTRVEPNFVDFGLAVPDVAGARSIEVGGRWGPATVSASATAPEVRIGGSQGGPRWRRGTMETVSWTGSDDDGDALTYMVQYSPDGGDKWTTLGAGLTGSDLDVAVDRLPGSNRARLRVLASDGFLTASDLSRDFRVQEAAPEVMIQGAPPSGIVVSGVPGNLTAFATDVEDGPVPDDALDWLVDGLPAAAGRAFDVSDLPIGTHVIGLRATDTSGDSSLASMAVHIVPDTTTRPVPPHLPSLTTSALAISECRPDSSHRVEVAWTIDGASEPIALSVRLQIPGRPAQEEASDAASGSTTFDLAIPAGTSAAVVVAFRDAAGAESATVHSLALPAVPGFVVDPVRLDFDARPGAPAAPQFLGVTQAGGATGGWQLTADAPWIRIDPTGITPDGATIAVRTTGLAPGMHRGAVVVADTGNAGCRLPVPVHLTKSYTELYLPAAKTDR